MICSNCETENSENEKICKNCGSNLNDENPNTTESLGKKAKIVEKNHLIKIIKVINTINIFLLSLAIVFEIISLYIPTVAFVFALLVLILLASFGVLQIIRNKYQSILNPKQKKHNKKSKKNTQKD